MIQRYIKLPPKHSFFLFGPRQCGKSTLIQQNLTEKTWTINLLEHPSFITYSKDPGRFLNEARNQIKKKGIKTVFIDEIQKVPPLLDEVHLLIQETGCRFILTGSSARKLKRTGTNLLAGRALTRHLFPFILPEIKSHFDLETALRFGLLPAVFFEEDNIKKEILNTYTQTYLKEEIQAEALVRNLGNFSRFLDVASASFTQPVNYSNIARECGIGSKTVQGYYDILEDTLIGFRLNGWKKSVRKQLLTQPKFYFFDNGVVNSINHYLKDDPNPVYKGFLFEQWIINEVRALLDYNQSDCQMNYWRTNAGTEVDLLLSKRGEIVAAVEIKSTSNPSAAHLSGLKSFNKEYPKVSCFLVANLPRSFETGSVRILSWEEFLTETIMSFI